MGVIENLRNLRAGTAREVVPVPLIEGESEIMRVWGNVRPGALNSVGGQLVLTTHRIYFSPWNTADLSGVLAWVLPKVGATALSAAAVRALQLQIDDSGVTAAREAVSSVRAGSGASVFKAPTVQVVNSNGGELEFGVCASFHSPNFLPANERVRDDFVAAAQRTL